MRRTGRTFRSVLKALVKVSEGQDVLYVTEYSDNSFKFALHVIQYLREDEIKIKPDTKEIYIGKGRIKFGIPKHSELHGRHPIYVED